MTEGLSIRPEKAEAGTPITVTVTGPNAYAVYIVPKGDKTAQPFKVRLSQAASQVAVGQFALYDAGEYVVEAGPWKASLSVREHHDLPFLVEFGLLAGPVTMIVGGLIIWNKRRKFRV